MADLTPSGQVLYILSTLRHQGMLTVREKNLLKGMLLRHDEQLYAVATDRPDGGFEGIHHRLRDLAVDEAEQRFNVVMKAFQREAPTFMNAAKEARAALRAQAGADTSLVYGEIEFRSFVDVLDQLKVPQNAKFVDLGSGCGKAVLAASLLLDFDELHGVEILKPLYDASHSVLDTFRQLEGDLHELPEDAVPITFHNADFLDWDWSWADVVFANSTCFKESLVADIAAKAALLKPGSLIITITQRLVHPSLEVVGHQKQHMSWGDGTFYIHRRRQPPFASGGSPNRPNISVDVDADLASAEAQSALKMMSSPQGAALLEAKRRRSRRQQASSGGLGPRESEAGSGYGGSAGANSSPVKRRQRGGGAREAFSPTLRMEMDAGFRPSSPQGDALRARKMRRFQPDPLP